MVLGSNCETSFLYTVDWDDNDPSGREESYEYVALDKTPTSMDIGVGTEVLFEQGHYRLQLPDGSYSHGYRWHLGIIDDVTTHMPYFTSLSEKLLISGFVVTWFHS